MTRILEKALEEASKLSRGDQDALAAMLLQDLAAERPRAEALGSSSEKLAKLADEPLAEFKYGKTRLIPQKHRLLTPPKESKS